MPMYRYVCENCGNEKVVLHGMNESPTIICDKCGSVMKKSIGRVGIIFKGSGFYSTDYRKDSGKKEDGKSESKSEKKEDVKV